MRRTGPSRGSWRAAQTHEVDTGNATNTDNLTQTVGATDSTIPQQSTVSDHSSYSYSHDLMVKTDALVRSPTAARTRELVRLRGRSPPPAPTTRSTTPTGTPAATRPIRMTAPPAPGLTIKPKLKPRSTRDPASRIHSPRRARHRASMAIRTCWPTAPWPPAQGSGAKNSHSPMRGSPPSVNVQPDPYWSMCSTSWVQKPPAMPRWSGTSSATRTRSSPPPGSYRWSATSSPPPARYHPRQLRIRGIGRRLDPPG